MTSFLPLQPYPPADRGLIVVWGLLASYPFGGMAWQVLHYVVGLRRLGFDVWYVEDSDRYVFDPVTYCRTTEYSANLAYLAGQLESVGLGDRWIFRPPTGEETSGARNRAGLRKLYREADAVWNLCGSQELLEEHLDLPGLVLVETDPVLNQVCIASGNTAVIEQLDRYRYLFTYGENIGAPDCLVPVERYTWYPTRPPVCLEWWQPASPAPRDGVFTTVANWKHKGKDLVWQGHTWRWSKDHEFRRFLDLPQRASAPLEIAIGAVDEQDEALLHTHGWRTSASSNLADPLAYRDYIRGSCGEFTVAKEQYVRSRSGWFSDRSVCYLAAGRPVITQDTGFGKFVRTGEGLFAFSTTADILAAMEAICVDYPRHSKAARDIAFEFFQAERVVGDMLRRMGLL